MVNKLHILHLEDDPRDTELMIASLRHAEIECEVVRVDTREQFVEKLRSGSFDVIISDVAVPGFDGISAQTVWKEERPHIPFIFLSGTFGEEVAIERLKEGATDYVLKNWMDKLPTVVRRALREMHDRAGREHAQSQLERLNMELESRVQERTAQLSAANEVPAVTGPEANGRGNVTISFNVPRDAGGAVTGAGTASFAIQLSGFPPGTPAILAHIHPGATGQVGPPLVNTNLAPATALVLGDGTVNVTLTAPVGQVDAAAITANPAGYYFNVHTQLNPGGAVRGQLTRTQ